MSFMFINANLAIISIIIILSWESENNFREIFIMNKDNEKEKVKWFSILDSLPFYIMIYDRIKEKLSYLNKYSKETLFPTFIT